MGLVLVPTFFAAFLLFLSDTFGIKFVLVLLFLWSPLLVIYFGPRVLLNHVIAQNPEVLFRVPTNRKIVALSVNDSPTFVSTRAICWVLNKYNVKATFFVIGNNVKNYLRNEGQNVLKQLVNEGHELGNKELNDTETIMQQAGWKKSEVNWFRPDFGFLNRKTLESAKDLGLTAVLGTVYSHDAYVPFAYINAWFILRKIQPGDIVIVHDRYWTPKLLEIILPELQKRGFEITTICNLVKACE